MRLPERAPTITAAVAAVIALLVAVAHPGGAGAALPTARAQEVDDAVAVRGTRQTPWVARDGTWELDLEVTGAPAGAQVEATLHSRIVDRQTFNEALFGLVDGPRRAGVPPVPLDTAPTTASGGREVRLAITLRQEGPSPGPGWAYLSDGLRAGVHPILVRVVDAEGVELAHRVAFLTRVAAEGEAGGDDEPLLVAPVLALDLPATPGSDATDPVGGVPEPGGDPPTTTTPSAGGDDGGDGGSPTTTDRDEDADQEAADDPATATDPTAVDPVALATAATRVGEIADGLLVVPDLPATLIPRPRLVEAMAADADTRDALRDLRRAGRGRQVVDGTFVEIALPAWVDAGLDDEIARQREWGNVALTDSLGLVDSGTWDATTGLTPDAVAQLWPVGIRSAILPAGSVDGASSLRPFTLSAGSSRTVRAVQVHDSLSNALVRGIDPDPILDEGAFAAELALTSADADGPAGVVVAPPPTWPTDDEAVARLGALLLDPLAPVRPVTVTALLDALDPSGAATLRAPAPVDLGSWPERLDLARNRLSSYSTMVGPADEEIATLDRRLLVSGDVSFTTDERIHEADVVLATLDTRFGSIEAPQRQTVTLTARDGRLPLALRNQLPVPATVAIEVDADGRIDLPDGARTVVELQPGTNQIDIPVHTRIPGDTPVDIAVRTTDGAVTLDEVRYTVRSTAVSGIGLILSIGAAAFLLLWWARHWTGSRRTRRRHAHPSSGSVPATGGTDDYADDGHEENADDEDGTGATPVGDVDRT